MTAPPDRYHALDSLRGFAMLLGVVLHAAISFVATNPPEFWLVHDNDPHELVDVFLLAVHTFRMQLFFLLAGFFGCLLYQRYGLGGMAWHRVKRVAIPFALAVVFVIPTVLAAFVYAELENTRAEGVPENATAARRACAEMLAANPEKGNLALIAGRFADTDRLPPLPLAHLWFLYYLLYFYAAVVLLAPPLGPLTGTRFLAALDGAFRRLIEGRWRVIVPAVVTLPVLLTMRSWIVDTPLAWQPEWPVLVYYFGFFAFGWMLYRHRDLVPAFGRGWKVNLAVANLLVLPLALGTLFTGMKAVEAAFAWRCAAFAAQTAYTWLMIVGLWGAFLHYFERERQWVRYMADASYWCYLMSITPIVLLQFWVKDWPLPGLVKWAFVSAAALAILLVTYALFVRHTFVGAILNGPRRKRAAEQERRENAPQMTQTDADKAKK